MTILNDQRAPATELTAKTIVLRTPAHPRGYRIELRRMRDAAELLGWLMHLSEKTWFTRQHLRDILDAAEHRNGIRIERGL